MTIPDYIKDSLDLYRDHRCPPGDCLRAVLSNDLLGAFSRADPDTAAAMRSIVMYISNDFPARAWGSPEKVEAWING
jgi:hypothetical protein